MSSGEGTNGARTSGARDPNPGEPESDEAESGGPELRDLSELRLGISCYPTYGGSGVVASELAKALASRGAEVHVLSYALPSRLATAPEGVFFHQVEVRPYPLFDYPPYSLALATKMVEVARRHDLPLMHVHYAVPNAVSAVLARQILAPRRLYVVTTLHGTDVTLVGNDPSYLETTRFGVLQSDAVTAVSESLRLTTLEQLELERDIDVVPNFVDLEQLERPEAGHDATRWRRNGERLLVHVSNFRRVKRVMDTVEILDRVRQRLPCRLLMVGDGPDRAKVEQEARKRGLDDAITFLGQLPHVEEVLWGADVFLLPSERESFGLAALEALACSVPVVGTRVGGLPDVVQDGQNGYLYEVGATDQMAAGVLDLLEDGELHRRFAQHARRWALGNFDRDPVVDRYVEVYRRTLADG